MNVSIHGPSFMIALALQVIVMVFGFPTIAQDLAHSNEHFEDVLKRAEGGDAIAQNLVGTLYQFGSGTPRNLATAFAWYERAAALNNAAAQVNLATLYMDGNGTAQDFTQGVDLLRLSADQGFPLAIAKLGHAHILGQGVPMNRREGMRLLQEASDLGDGFAANQIGIAHLFGYDVPIDSAEAVKWFKISAERGYATGQAVYAQYLPVGLEQLSWYARAANAGNAQAQFALGKELLDEMSEHHDREMAIGWLRLAADGGNGRAEQFLFQLGLPGRDGRSPFNQHPYTSTSKEWSREEMERAIIYFGVALGVAVILMDGPDPRSTRTEPPADCQPGGPCNGQCPPGHVLIAGICVFYPLRF